MTKKKRKRQRNPKMFGVDLIDFFDDYNDIAFLRYIPSGVWEGHFVGPDVTFGIAPEIDPIDPLAIYDVNAHPRELYVYDADREYIELTGLPANIPTIVSSFNSDMDDYVREKLEDELGSAMEAARYLPHKDRVDLYRYADVNFAEQLREYYRKKRADFVDALNSRSMEKSLRRREELLRLMQMRADSLNSKALAEQRALLEEAMFRENNPKKGRRRKKNPRRTKNAEVTPPQLTKYFEFPASTRWLRSPVGTFDENWTPVEPDELVRAYPRVSGVLSLGVAGSFGDPRPVTALQLYEEHPTNLDSLSAANYLTPIFKRNKTHVPAKKRLDQAPAPHLVRALAMVSEGDESPELAADNLFDVLPFARAGYTQSLYGDLLRLEMEGRIARGVGTGYDQTLAKIRDALLRRDEEAMGRILYDLQAYRTPERDDLIDYMNMAAKRSGLNLALASHPFMGLDVARLGGVPPKPWSGLFTDPRHILPRRENPKKKQQKKKPSSSKATRR